MRLNVYCAGKISPADWRHTLFPELRGALTVGGEGYPYAIRPEWLEDQQPISEPGTDYVGPFFLSCDHCCAHGPNGHGLAATDDPVTGEPTDIDWESDEYQPDAWGCIGGGDGGFSRSEVFAACTDWLKLADWVYVWVGQDFHTAHGSCVEIGMARALGIPVIAAIDSGLTDEAIREVWFPIQACTWKIRAPDPVSGFAVADQIIRSPIGRHWLRSELRKEDDNR